MKINYIIIIILILLSMFIHETTHVTIGKNFGCDYKGAGFDYEIGLYVTTTCEDISDLHYSNMVLAQSINDIFGYTFMFWFTVWLLFKREEGE